MRKWALDLSSHFSIYFFKAFLNLQQNLFFFWLIACGLCILFAVAIMSTIAVLSQRAFARSFVRQSSL